MNTTTDIANTSSDKRGIGFVGQPLELHVIDQSAPSKITITSVPKLSKAAILDATAADGAPAFVGTTITPDVPGVWKFEVRRHNRASTFTFAIFPAEALQVDAIKYRQYSHNTVRRTSNERSEQDQLGILRGIAQHVREDEIDALTADRPLPPLPHGLAPFGGDH